MKEFPSFEQVEQLPQLISKAIPPEYEDANGHVNVQYYLALFDESGWPMFNQLGMDINYFTERRSGAFDLEHHICYLAELHVGDEVAVHGRLLGRSAKRLHGVWFVVNRSRKEVACTIECVTSHADLEARRTSPWPEDVAQRLDTMIRDHNQVDWQAPVCGLMGA